MGSTGLNRTHISACSTINFITEFAHLCCILGSMMLRQGMACMPTTPMLRFKIAKFWGMRQVEL